MDISSHLLAPHFYGNKLKSDGKDWDQMPESQVILIEIPKRNGLYERLLKILTDQIYVGM